MKQITLYPYDEQLRPGVIGADFETFNINGEHLPNEDFTIRFEEDEAEKLMGYICRHFKIKREGPRFSAAENVGKV